VVKPTIVAAKPKPDEIDGIVPELAALAVPIDSVKPHPRNVNHNDPAEIAQGLRIYGQYKPIVVQRSTGFICVGNHTWRAARDHRKWTEIAAVLRDLDDESALQLAIWDNRSGRKGEDDQQALAELLQEFSTLEGTGYSDADLTELLESLAGPQEKMPVPGDAETDELDQTWGVIVTCRTEGEQLALLDRLDAEGLSVRALMA
jgi:ParB-like chromosome segregation protein Spo0J